MYRRLTQNPNFYELTEVSGRAVNDYLCDLFEQAVDELKDSKCILQEEEESNDLSLLNLGQIAGHYYIDVQTISVFNKSAKAGKILLRWIEQIFYLWLLQT